MVKRILDCQHYTNKKRTKNESVNTLPNMMKCPCGGGQSCIVNRRWVGDWVHEDDVFNQNNVPLRKNCYQAYNSIQEELLKNIMNQN